MFLTGQISKEVETQIAPLLERIVALEKQKKELLSEIKKLSCRLTALEEKADEMAEQAEAVNAEVPTATVREATRNEPKEQVLFLAAPDKFGTFSAGWLPLMAGKDVLAFSPLPMPWPQRLSVSLRCSSLYAR